MKKLIWLIWIIVLAAIGGYYAYMMFSAEDKEQLLIGETTHGHYQIELACTACHTEPFGGTEVLQNACLNCHEKELKEARDSHPKKKFTDPRNADMLEVLDARYCISCHTEHQEDRTHPMGLTLPTDYCFHCHEDVGSDRTSHKDLGFETCASAGCHNYHDNRALYEDFLVDNAVSPWLLETAAITEANAAKQAPIKISYKKDFTEKLPNYPASHPDWHTTSHAQAGVSCGGCHSDEKQQWIEKPGVAECRNCHESEASGFLAGKHGMRLAQGLSGITTDHARLAFKESSYNQAHGCTSCHGAHEFNTQSAATESCLSCHDDQHSRAFEQSPHGQLAQQNLPAEELVSCATCHMPRLENSNGSIFVQHNQNDNLRPNEKMIRPVCMQCHSLEFSIDALADPELILNNFSHKPSQHIPSIDWALKRVK